MAYFLSPALVQLRAEINALWPGRDRASDGWIGDAAHGARKSDHNPDYSSGGIVRAIDIDEDLVAGLTHVGEAMPLVDQIIRDPRVAYAIYEGQIWQNPAVFSRGGWLPYHGANAHRHHIHVSVRHGSAWDRASRAWGLVRSLSNGGGGGSLPSLPTGGLNPLNPLDPITPSPWEDDMALSNDAVRQITDAVVAQLRPIIAEAGKTSGHSVLVGRTDGWWLMDVLTKTRVALGQGEVETLKALGFRRIENQPTSFLNDYREVRR